MRDQIVAAGRELLGTPFRPGGRDRSGVDCAGLVLLALDGAGIRCEVPVYGRNPDPGWMRRQIEALADEVADPGPGDVLLLRCGRREHLALVTEPGRILHAYQGAGCVCEHAIDEHWAARVVASYRVRGAN